MAVNSQPQPMMTQAQAAEMLKLQRRADRRGGCLFGIVMTLLFGVFYWLWLALSWIARELIGLTRSLWALCVFCWRWSVAGARWAWPHVLRYGRAFHARYGARGWAAVGVVVAVLCLIGLLFGHH